MVLVEERIADLDISVQERDELLPGTVLQADNAQESKLWPGCLHFTGV